MNTTKNNSIVVWRIIFTYLILIFHFDNKYCISTQFDIAIGWYIGVEFFFIVSGYLLYTGLDRLSKKCRSGWDYLVYRYGKIYPYYFTAFMFSLVCFILTRSVSLVDVVKFLSNDFFELFALHGIGLDDGWAYLNNTGWFISVMFLSGFIIYHCLVKWKEQFCNFAAPLIIIISFSYLYRNVKGIGAVVEISGFYGNMALMRGLADMCLGIMAARLNGFLAQNCRKTGLLRLAGGVGFLFVILCSLVFGNSTTDFLYVMILTVSVAIAFLPAQTKFLQSRWLQRWSALTMSMYFVHDAFRTFLFPAVLGIPEKLGMKVVYLLLYLAVVTVSAVIFEFLVKRMIKGIGTCWGVLTGKDDACQEKRDTAA